MPLSVRVHIVLSSFQAANSLYNAPSSATMNIIPSLKSIQSSSPSRPMIV